jgi:hypothetical protein
MARVVEYADEWMPHPDRGDRALKDRIADFWQLSESAGRGRLPVTVFGSRAEPQLVEDYRAAGVTRCVFRLPSASAEEVLPALKRTADVIRQVVA